jgi:hypothetical protein
VRERRTGSPESLARRKRSLSARSSGKQAFGTLVFCVLCATQERRIQRFSRLSSSRSASTHVVLNRPESVSGSRLAHVQDH